MSQPFDRLIVHQLRGLKELDLTGLGQVNLLVGGNDSGKTTVLEALSLLSKPLSPFTWVATPERREPQAIHGRMRTQEQLRWLFPQQATLPRDVLYQGSASLSAEGASPVTHVNAHFQEVKSIRLEGSDRGPKAAPQQVLADGIERFGTKLSVAAMQRAFEGGVPDLRLMDFTIWEDGAAENLGDQGERAVPIRVINPHEHRTDAIFLKEFSDARMRGFQESVRGLLREIDPRILGLEILAPRGMPMLFLQDSVAGIAPLSAFGDGIRRALLMALAIPKIQGGALLIDELETAIHVSALTKLFRWMLSACKQYNVQLFATTHSLEAVDAILSVDTTPEEDIVGYRLERTEGRSEAKRFGEGMLKRLRYERGLDVR